MAFKSIQRTIPQGTCVIMVIIWGLQKLGKVLGK
jgi:hypothetical protein